jgi:hypothetical protein
MKKTLIALGGAALLSLPMLAVPASAHSVHGITVTKRVDVDTSARRRHCHVRKVVKFRHGRKIVNTTRVCH